MITRKSHRYRKLTPMQRHDVWEVKDVDEITEEVQKVMKSMGLSTEEVEKTLPRKGDNKNE